MQREKKPTKEPLVPKESKKCKSPSLQNNKRKVNGETHTT